MRVPKITLIKIILVILSCLLLIDKILSAVGVSYFRSLDYITDYALFLQALFIIFFIIWTNKKKKSDNHNRDNK